MKNQKWLIVCLALLACTPKQEEKKPTKPSAAEIEACNRLWQGANDTLAKLIKGEPSVTLKDLVEQIPLPQKPFLRCNKQRAVCASGPRFIKQNAAEFLRAIKQERLRATNLNCFFTSSAEFAHQSPATRRAGLRQRIQLLQAVQDTDLKDIRDEMIRVIKAHL